MTHRSATLLFPSVCACVCVCENHLVLPQGWYSLGLLVEEGFRLPVSILVELGLSELYLADGSLLLSTLYSRCVPGCVPHAAVFSTKNSAKNPLICSHRCRDSETTDSYVPCSLALFSVHLQSFQKEYGAAMKVSVGMQQTAANQQDNRCVSLLYLSVYLPQFSAAVAVVAGLCSFGAIRRSLLPLS